MKQTGSAFSLFVSFFFIFSSGCAVVYAVEARSADRLLGAAQKSSALPLGPRLIVVRWIFLLGYYEY